MSEPLSSECPPGPHPEAGLDLRKGLGEKPVCLFPRSSPQPVNVIVIIIISKKGCWGRAPLHALTKQEREVSSHISLPRWLPAYEGKWCNGCSASGWKGDELEGQALWLKNWYRQSWDEQALREGLEPSFDRDKDQLCLADFVIYLWNMYWLGRYANLQVLYGKRRFIKERWGKRKKQKQSSLGQEN